MEREGSFAFLNLRSCAIGGVVCEHIQGSGIVCPVRVHDVLLLGCVTGVLVVFGRQAAWWLGAHC